MRYLPPAKCVWCESTDDVNDITGCCDSCYEERFCIECGEEVNEVGSCGNCHCCQCSEGEDLT